ncbi:hypothetical protein [Epilithonimonas hungarica]|uniref:Glycosyltransferase family 1 protein n=1 Tax=Epilithonimonas hungarica TaxID=454006 RepID=A0A1G7FLR6_9FLAO|nr:hypothetical protein [Epilithonimonas hungarica]SDE76816.1 hypothetical protein SAMN05421825_0146 [Epilithonimonas hungarica]
MKVLFAYNITASDNEYVSRLIEISQAIDEVEITASLEEFWSPTTRYDAIIINWPDYLFRWKRDISDAEVEKLIALLDEYKKSNTKIITILHDEYAHHSRSENRNKIFDICYQNCDVLAHLGEFSLKKYKEEFRHLKVEHKLLYHPAYKYFDFDLDNLKTRTSLGFKPKDFIIIVPGGVRHQYEEDYINKIFKSLKIKNKKLIYVRASHIDKPKKELSPKFLTFKTKELFVKIFHKRHYKYKFLDSKVLSQYLTIADLIILPRIDILNSGNVILGSQYDKLIIGPKIGNIDEWLIRFDQISIDPKDVDKNIENNSLHLTVMDYIKKNASHKKHIYGDETILQQLQEILS